MTSAFTLVTAQLISRRFLVARSLHEKNNSYAEVNFCNWQLAELLRLKRKTACCWACKTMQHQQYFFQAYINSVWFTLFWLRYPFFVILIIIDFLKQAATHFIMHLRHQGMHITIGI